MTPDSLKKDGHLIRGLEAQVLAIDEMQAIEEDMKQCRERGVCWLCGHDVKEDFVSGVVPDWWTDCACPCCIPVWAWPKHPEDTVG